MRDLVEGRHLRFVLLQLVLAPPLGRLPPLEHEYDADEHEHLGDDTEERPERRVLVCNRCAITCKGPYLSLAP